MALGDWERRAALAALALPVHTRRAGSRFPSGAQPVPAAHPAFFSVPVLVGSCVSRCAQLCALPRTSASLRSVSSRALGVCPGRVAARSWHLAWCPRSSALLVTLLAPADTSAATGGQDCSGGLSLRVSGGTPTPRPLLEAGSSTGGCGGGSP